MHVLLCIDTIYLFETLCSRKAFDHSTELLAGTMTRFSVKERSIKMHTCAVEIQMGGI